MFTNKMRREALLERKMLEKRGGYGKELALIKSLIYAR